MTEQEKPTDAGGNVVRGRGGDTMGFDRGPVRGGLFEAISGPTLQASPEGASSSVEGWVLMLSNLSPATTENDIRLLLSDVDPTGDLLGDNNNNNNNGGNGGPAGDIQFITDLRMNPSAATCGCVGHAFIKVPTLEFAYAAKKLNGRDFVDDLQVRVDFAFAVPEPQANEDDADGGNKDRHHARSNEAGVAPRAPQRTRDEQ